MTKNEQMYKELLEHFIKKSKQYKNENILVLIYEIVNLIVYELYSNKYFDFNGYKDIIVENNIDLEKIINSKKYHTDNPFVSIFNLLTNSTFDYSGDYYISNLYGLFTENGEFYLANERKIAGFDLDNKSQMKYYLNSILTDKCITSTYKFFNRPWCSDKNMKVFGMNTFTIEVSKLLPLFVDSSKSINKDILVQIQDIISTYLLNNAQLVEMLFQMNDNKNIIKTYVK